VRIRSTLRRGAQGLDVRELQIKLNMWLGTVRGSIQLKVDQIFGKNTEAVLQTFQKAHSLKVDGIADPLTWAQLPQF
jgi:peptidoglycan hydrolase-like protein with peptidoglycan-binding domain